jgi:hypothetical protein
MTPYYVWPALAVGVVVAARRNAWLFALAVAAAVFTTVAAQWELSTYPWWIIDVVGLTIVLLGSLPASSLAGSDRPKVAARSA